MKIINKVLLMSIGLLAIQYSCFAFTDNNCLSPRVSFPVSGFLTNNISLTSMDITYPNIKLYQGEYDGIELYVAGCEHGKVKGGLKDFIEHELKIDQQNGDWVFIVEGGLTSNIGDYAYEENRFLREYAKEWNIPIYDPIVQGNPLDPAVEDSIIKKGTLTSEEYHYFTMIELLSDYYQEGGSLDLSDVRKFLVNYIWLNPYRSVIIMPSQEEIIDHMKTIEDQLNEIARLSTDDFIKQYKGWLSVFLQECNIQTRSQLLTVLDKELGGHKKVLIVLGANHVNGVDPLIPLIELSDETIKEVHSKIKSSTGVAYSEGLKAMLESLGVDRSALVFKGVEKGRSTEKPLFTALERWGSQTIDVYPETTYLDEKKSRFSSFFKKIISRVRGSYNPNQLIESSL